MSAHTGSRGTVFASGWSPIFDSEVMSPSKVAKTHRKSTYESTNRSRLTQSGFFGLKVMNLLKRICATGARPMGAPGCPEFALKVASTWNQDIFVINEHNHEKTTVTKITASCI